MGSSTMPQSVSQPANQSIRVAPVKTQDELDAEMRANVAKQREQMAQLGWNSFSNNSNGLGVTGLSVDQVMQQARDAGFIKPDGTSPAMQQPSVSANPNINASLVSQKETQNTSSPMAPSMGSSQPAPSGKGGYTTPPSSGQPQMGMPNQFSQQYPIGQPQVSSSPISGGGKGASTSPVSGTQGKGSSGKGSGNTSSQLNTTFLK